MFGGLGLSQHVPGATQYVGDQQRQLARCARTEVINSALCSTPVQLVQSEVQRALVKTFFLLVFAAYEEI